MVACRYIEYICDMASEKPTLPHNKQLVLSSLTLSPVPLFNKNK